MKREMSRRESELRAAKIRVRRAADPVREARRQHELTRMRRRVVDYVPLYRELSNGREVVAQVYLGHRPVYATRGK